VKQSRITYLSNSGLHCASTIDVTHVSTEKTSNNPIAVTSSELFAHCLFKQAVLSCANIRWIISNLREGMTVR